MSEVERGNSKELYIGGNPKRTHVSQTSGLPPLRATKMKRQFILSGGRKVEAEHVIIPGTSVSEMTVVHELNPRNQDAVDENSTRDIYPKVKDRGIDTEGIAVAREGRYFIIEGSRRRYCAIKAVCDLPLWVFNEELSPDDILCIVNAAQSSKKFSYREVGLKYIQTMKEQDFRTNEDLARYTGVSVESIRKRVQAANIDARLINVFPDCEGIPNSFYSKLAKIQKIASSRCIDISDLTSEVGLGDEKPNISINIEEIQRSILDGLESALRTLTQDSTSSSRWIISDIAEFDSKDKTARIKRSQDGRKVIFEFNRMNQNLIDDIERLIKLRINKSS